MLPRLIDVRIDISPLQEKAVSVALGVGFSYGMLFTLLLVVLVLLWKSK
jgi:hypothetical protein